MRCCCATIYAPTDKLTPQQRRTGIMLISMQPLKLTVRRGAEDELQFVPKINR